MQRVNPSRLALVTLAAGLLVVSFLRAADETREVQPSRSFTIGSDPAEPVVALTWIAGLTYDHGRYLLYGDGRFVHDTRTYSGDLLGSQETTLPFELVRELVAVAVDHGLMDTDDAEIEQRLTTLRREHPRRARVIVNDAGSSVFTISLTSYTREGVATGPITKRFTVGPVKHLSTLFPEVPELAGLAELSDRLQAIGMQLKEKESGAGGHSIVVVTADRSLPSR